MVTIEEKVCDPVEQGKAEVYEGMFLLQYQQVNPVIQMRASHVEAGVTD